MQTRCAWIVHAPCIAPRGPKARINPAPAKTCPARPRQVAMSLSKQLTMRSLPDIGRRFGGRDHTTIIHGVKRIEDLMATDSQLSDDLQLLRRLLQG